MRKPSVAACSCQKAAQKYLFILFGTTSGEAETLTIEYLEQLMENSGKNPSFSFLEYLEIEEGIDLDRRACPPIFKYLFKTHLAEKLADSEDDISCQRADQNISLYSLEQPQEKL